MVSVLKLPSHFRLLSLGTAAPHRVDPLASVIRACVPAAARVSRRVLFVTVTLPVRDQIVHLGGPDGIIHADPGGGAGARHTEFVMG